MECQDGIGKICAMPMNAPQQQSNTERLTYSQVPKFGRNGTLPVVYDPTNFKTHYTDEYTGEVLPPQLIRDAIEDELNDFNSKVWQISPIEDTQKVLDHILVRSRWVLSNKGDSQAPDVRAKLASCELNKGDRNDMFPTPTPPLKAKRMLFARCVSEQERKGKPLKLSFIDVRKTYFNALPNRAIYMRLPTEIRFPSNAIARQVKCVYGTIDARKLWEDCYTQVRNSMGFQTGVSNPCAFYHPARNITIVVHGDDFTALATDDERNWYETEFHKYFEIKSSRNSKLYWASANPNFESNSDSRQRRFHLRSQS